MKLNLFNQEKLDFDIQNFVPKIEMQFAGFETSDVNVILIPKDQMQELNNQYRKINSVTDVLSFNLEDTGFLGEVYICPDYVKENISKEEFEEEILRLVVHGILHLLGYDHDVELNDQTKEKIEMFVKQEKILQNVIS